LPTTGIIGWGEVVVVEFVGEIFPGHSTDGSSGDET
jgi:hypothetical protein